jgi:hypothetical protein
MRINASAMIRFFCLGFLGALLSISMILITTSAPQAQLTQRNPSPTSIRDRILPPQIASLGGQGSSCPFARAIDGPAKRPSGARMPQANPDRGLTVPYWSDSFSYLGITYIYSMVGTDPKRGSATTVVPTVIIPMRFVFENGLVYDASADNIDGQTSVQGIIGSPVFQNYDFASGGVHVGNTQYADAFQRANFWDSVSRKSPDYHVLLGQPTVLPAFEVFVPNTMATFYSEGNGSFIPAIDEDLLQEATINAIINANVSPQDLAIAVWGDVQGTLTSGYHRDIVEPGGTQTYIATGYHPRIPAFGYFSDAFIFSHEAIEWLDDPFSNYNFTPGWNPVFVSYPRCLSQITADELEVGDVLEFTSQGSATVNMANGVYHLQDGAFVDYFTRNNTSRSVNGQYSFFGVATGPSTDCIGHLEIQPTLIYFPNAAVTVALGINDHGQIVGIYVDTSNIVHGFLFDHGSYTTLDYPSAIETDPGGINNSGQISGTYFDTVGLPHGFVYSQGRFSPVNFPGAIDTLVNGINSRGEFVGGYDDASSVTHGLSFQSGQLRSIDAPFGSQTQVSSVNDLGQMLGYTWSNPNGPFGGFIFDGRGFSRFDVPGALDTFPNAINDQGEHGGSFDEYDIFFGTIDGFGYVTINGRPYALYYYLIGMNSQNQIVGNAFNNITNRRVGFVATLPNH